MSKIASPGLTLRGVTPPLSLKNFGLIAFDMDSTLINIECVDEVADAAGRKAEVSAITEAAMRGEITDYKDSLRRRVALLKGVPEGALSEVYQQLAPESGGRRTGTSLQGRGLESAARERRLHLLHRPCA
jgi:phosphoserine phosphatase